MSLWGGRFSGKQDPAFEAFQRSLPFDRELWREDIAGSQAWVRAQVRCGALSKREGARLVAALGKLARRLARDPRPLATSKAEDVHGFVEAELVEELGDLGRKLHTGRSRNDQVATDLRLWCKRRGPELDAALVALMSELVRLALREHATAMPGYTHLQRAQIVTAGHHALAYVEMLARDRERLAGALNRLDVSPLGSGALAGSFLPVDRERLARDLGFREASRNSLDAVADRDFVAELLFVATLSAAHLSRFAEDWIFFASQEAGFLQLSDAVTTGSSLMPHKKNPDSLELVRGKGARVLGRLTAFLACLRSLPLAYDKDLQEDKEALFEALATWEACLVVARLAVRGARYDRRACRAACERGFLDATELCGYLVGKGVPFRTAHEQVGRLVRHALDKGRELRELPLAALRAIAPRVGPDVERALATDQLLRARRVLGAANPERVKREALVWQRRLTKRPRPS